MSIIAILVKCHPANHIRNRRFLNCQRQHLPPAPLRRHPCTEQVEFQELNTVDILLEGRSTLVWGGSRAARH